MPTKTFFNLSLDKQRRLIEAGEREFSRVDFSESSINRIIQDAKISRGSFYMYFTDKEDLYFFVLEKYIMQIYQELLKNMDQCQGDFIRAFLLLHEKLIDSCLKEQGIPLFRNAFLSLRFTTEQKMKLKPSKDVVRKNNQEILSHIDQEIYCYQQEEELLDAFSLVMLITVSSVAYILMNPTEIVREKENYNRRLEIVRFGVLRRENKDD